MAVTINGTTGSISLALPPGMVMYFANSTAPGGWLECNGAAVSRITYADLFVAIGIVYGSGDGATTFNLPDLRGQFVRGWSNGAAIDSGRTIGSSQLDQMQQITGSVTNIGRVHSGSSNVGTGALSITGSAEGNNGIAAGGNTGVNIGFNNATSTGARVGTETRPTNVAMMACIKF
jgi:microcystin-dependent protein